jgi:hypothetical protein
MVEDEVVGKRLVLLGIICMLEGHCRKIENNNGAYVRGVKQKETQRRKR